MGGEYQQGAIFSLLTNGTLAAAASFDNTNNGRTPMAGLTATAQGSWLGLATSGGSNGLGTVFEFDPAGTLTPLFAFGGSNGASPVGELVRGRDGQFYGTTSEGGAYSMGTVFRMTPGGLVTPLVSFAGTNGANPHSGLVQSAEGAFYGTTYSGGTHDLGTVFRLTPEGELTVLLHFDGTNGANPVASLALGADGQLYGVAANGGPNQGGTVFMVALDPRIATQPASQTVLAGSIVSLSVTAHGSAPLSYQWQWNGANLTDGPLVSGALTANLLLSQVATNQTGDYTVLVAGPSGALRSSAATLTVLPPGAILVSLLPDKNIALSFNAITNYAVRIEASTNLHAWETLTNYVAPEGVIQFFDPQATHYPQRYYRAVWTP